MSNRDRPKHFKSQRTLVNGVGGGCYIQQYGSSLPNNFCYRVAVVTAVSPEVLIVPDIFANRDAQLLAIEAEYRLPFRRLKIARFVEDVINGKQHLALLENHAPAANERRLVGDGLPCSILYPAGVTHNRR